MQMYGASDKMLGYILMRKNEVWTSLLLINSQSHTSIVAIELWTEFCGSEAFYSCVGL